MKIGTLNNPAKGLIEEIKRASKQRFDFVDITLEGEASYDKIDPQKVKESLKKYNLDAIGHTAYWIPYGDPFPELREASVEIFKKCMNAFKKIGIEKVNIHVPIMFSTHDRFYEDHIESTISSLKEIIKIARGNNQIMMLENYEPWLDFDDFKKIMKAVPELHLHLDIGHANLKRRNFERYLKKFSKRLEHVHLHDNHGKEDDHLGLGKGTLNVKKQ